MNKGFVHLHLHSQYSLLESSITFEDLAKRAADYKMPAVAVTDNGNMFESVEFYLECQMQGIKPILGCDMYVAPESRFIKTLNKEQGRHPQAQNFSRVVLLCQNLNGYRNLCQLVSRGFTEGFYYKPRIDYEILNQYKDDLIALSGSVYGDVPSTFTKQGEDAAYKKIEIYKNIFGNKFYLELQRTSPRDEALNQFLIKAARSTGLKLVATNEPYYLDQGDSFAQEVLMCIKDGKTLQDDKRPKLPSDQFYFKSAEQMRELFSDLPEACDHTLEIAEMCDVQFNFKDEKGNKIYHLPTFNVAQGKTVSQEIKELSESGLQKRFEEMALRGEEVLEDKKPDYYKRLEFELGVIDRMGFNGYFLIVQDFINYAKKNGIPVGPGRGSGAGSLVAYSLRITDLDPLKYNLLFERFLNPERISMPDFDVDFCQDRRGEVIQYVTEKYGAGSVAQIITFGKLQTRAAIRDVGRALGIPYSEVDLIAKLVPDKLGITLQEALDQEPRFKEMSESDPKVATLLETALKLEGLTRHASIHAAGIIISNLPLVEHCPLYRGNEGETVIQFDMIQAENIGLIKFDFLGLKTLTMIENTIKLVKRNYPQDEKAQKLSSSLISLSDPSIYELLSKGDTAGVFQFEGDGISDLIRKFKPTCFEDITAINALYRPGPMNMLDEYVARKHGKIKVSYLFPQLEEILKETYGIIVYQEQVQLIAAKCANYSLGEADILRRAMGKKKPEEMAKQKTRFLKGCAENGFNSKKSEELFELMAKFAEYGFNKSHAAAYCVVAAQTAYLKAHYRAEFYAALLTTEMGDTDKVVKYIRDATQHGLKIKGPDINYSEYHFSAMHEKETSYVVFGLGGVKGIGEAAVQAIIEARAQLLSGKFSSLLEFFETVDLRRVNKKVVECLIKSGAFDELYSNRAQLFEGFDKFLETADIKRRDREKGQVSLFEMESFESSEKVELPDKPDWPRSQKLTYEKEVLGFYISDHPLNGLETVMKNHVTSLLKGLETEQHKKKISVGGMISELREIITKKGSRMAFGQVEDQFSQVEVIFFPEMFAKYQLPIRSGKPVIIKGTLEREKDNDEMIKIIAEEVHLLEKLVNQSREVTLKLAALETVQSDIEIIQKIILKYKGEIKSRLQIGLVDLKKEIIMDLDPEYAVNPTETFLEEIEKTFGSKVSIHIT